MPVPCGGWCCSQVAGWPDLDDLERAARDYGIPDAGAAAAWAFRAAAKAAEAEAYRVLRAWAAERAARPASRGPGGEEARV